MRNKSLSQIIKNKILQFQNVKHKAMAMSILMTVPHLVEVYPPPNIELIFKEYLNLSVAALSGPYHALPSIKPVCSFSCSIGPNLQ